MLLAADKPCQGGHAQSQQGDYKKPEQDFGHIIKRTGFQDVMAQTCLRTDELPNKGADKGETDIHFVTGNYPVNCAGDNNFSDNAGVGGGNTFGTAGILFSDGMRTT